jgi:hypothetical protein
MAAPAHPPPVPRVLPGDVQGTSLAAGMMRGPTVAAAVFGFLTYADATPLREACRGFRGAVGEHPWALPVSLWSSSSGRVDQANYLRVPAQLARWRACFPLGRSLLLSGFRPTERESYLVYQIPAEAQLTDADLVPLTVWGLAHVSLEGLTRITAAGLAAVCTPALTTLSLQSTPQPSLLPTPKLSVADVAAATAASAPNLRNLDLVTYGTVADSDLAGWRQLHALTLGLAHLCPNFTGAGLAVLTNLRYLRLLLLFQPVIPWSRRVLAGLPCFVRLDLLGTGARATAHAPLAAGCGLLDGVRPSLQTVRLCALRLEWPAPGGVPDGGTALLAPLARVSRLELWRVFGVTDAGVACLTGARTLELIECPDLVGEALAPLAGSLTCVSVRHCGAFTGAGLGRLSRLTQLEVAGCAAFRLNRLPHDGSGQRELPAFVSCPRLERVRVTSVTAASKSDAAGYERALEQRSDFVVGHDGGGGAPGLVYCVDGAPIGGYEPPLEPAEAALVGAAGAAAAVSGRSVADGTSDSGWAFKRERHTWTGARWRDAARAARLAAGGLAAAALAPPAPPAAVAPVVAVAATSEAAAAQVVSAGAGAAAAEMADAHGGDDKDDGGGGRSPPARPPPAPGLSCL